jgi:hypothetical protein
MKSDFLDKKRKPSPLITYFLILIYFQATPKIVKVDDDEESEIEEEIIESNLETEKGTWEYMFLVQR